MASVDIDFGAKTATVTCRPGTSLSRAAIEAALQPGGYGVSSFSAATPTVDSR